MTHRTKKSPVVWNVDSRAAEGSLVTELRPHGPGQERDTLKLAQHRCAHPGACWPYLLGLHGERAHLPRQVHVAQGLRAVTADAVGVVASAEQHGAEQCAEVEAVPLLLLEHRGRGIQVRRLWAGRSAWWATAPQRPPPVWELR